MNDNVEFRIDPHPPLHAFAPLWHAAWGFEFTGNLESVLNRSLVHLGAFADERLIGYVNVAWDGGTHAFLLDPTVHPDFRHGGIGSGLVRRAIELSRERGAGVVHVDYEPHLDGFYKACGFTPTLAGLIRLDGEA
jgi:GNAT superfamily N-acetyltransferase